jgi:hypothetical protein
MTGAGRSRPAYSAAFETTDRRPRLDAAFFFERV